MSCERSSHPPTQEVLSLLLMWSEATIWLNLTGLVSPNLSVFGLLLSAAVDRNDYFSILLASSLPLAYMCLLTMYSVFKLKIFNVLDLSGNQNTDPYSLLVNASLMNRLQFSLAFNFLNVLMHSRDKVSGACGGWGDMSERTDTLPPHPTPHSPTSPTRHFCTLWVRR